MDSRLRRAAHLPVLVAVLAALALGASPAAATQPTIVGGQPTSIVEHPWQVAVLVGDPSSNGITLCGGSLIASTWVLTAAHCVAGRQPGEVQVHAGISAMSQRSDASRLPIASIQVHPQADVTNYVYDVALLQLAAPVAPAAERQVIALPLGQDPLGWPSVGTPLRVTGWGALAENGPSSDQLQTADVQVLADANGPCGSYGTSYAGASQLCVGVPAGGVDTCQGDSGGPLVVDLGGVRTLAGVTSVGFGCAQAAYPGLYTRTAAILPWIQQFADIPTGPPTPPTAVTATALSGGRALVSWQPSAGGGGAGVTSFTVTASPGGAGCVSAVTSCQVPGLRPGTAYTFTVQGGNAAGAGGASQPSASLVAVHATRKAGTVLRTSTIARWLKVGAPKRAVVATRSVCRVVGTRVEVRRPGTCVVSVVGSAGRGRAYIAVA